MDPRLVHERLNTDLQFFAEHGPLHIKDKTGDLIRFRFNLAQRYIHDKLEAQRKEKGWVRAVLLKGRQQGGSTYVGMRYYHRARSVPGTGVFILSHDGKTTDKLFKMVERAHENVRPQLRPTVGSSNRYQLSFPELRSDYAVGTAGNENVGRGGTAQLFHGSEVAYWDNAYAIQDGALESIALARGTEIILESTANGPVGLFYDKAMAALKGQGDYILIFIPWFWQDEYERDVDVKTFQVTEEEQAIIDAYFSRPFPYHTEPISEEKRMRKLAWRRAKILDLSTGQNVESGKAKFRQIYPNNPVEAFQSTGVGLFRPDAIAAARKSSVTDEGAPVIAGVDPAGDSDDADRTVIALRRGREVLDIFKYPRMRPMELAGICAKLLEKHGVDMMFIDRGYGEGTIDRLHELGYARKVIGVAFNERPLNPDVYLNKRSEMIIECAKWINAGGVRVPDDDDVHAAFACVPVDEETSNGLKFLKSKREIKRALGGALLLDIVDAVALTFSYPVKRAAGDANPWRKAGTVSGRPAGSPLASLNRKRGRI